MSRLLKLIPIAVSMLRRLKDPTRVWHAKECIGSAEVQAGAKLT